MKIAIYERFRINEGAGGPPGYLWNLREGLRKIDECEVVFLEQSGARQPSRVGRSRISDTLVNVLKNVSPSLWRLLKSFGPSRLKKEVLAATTETTAIFLPHWAESKLREGCYDLLHCHCTEDAIQAQNSLVRLGLRESTRIVTTIHCPELPYRERLAGLRAHGLHASLEAFVEQGLENIDNAGVLASDGFIFPAPEAIEHFSDWIVLQQNLAAKPVKYVLTGICDSKPDVNLNLQIPDARLTLLYAGRHNEVKGYDLISSVVPALLDRTDTVMIVAGTNGPLQAPNHRKWFELGWIANIRGLMKRCDAFLLPNRSTYFDLVALEVLAAGKMLVASRTGGNKVLGRLAPGVLLFDPTERGLGDVLDMLAGLDIGEISSLGEQNREVFMRHFTADQFASKYMAALRELNATFAESTSASTRAFADGRRESAVNKS